MATQKSNKVTPVAVASVDSGPTASTPFGVVYTNNDAYRLYAARAEALGHQTSLYQALESFTCTKEQALERIQLAIDATPAALGGSKDQLERLKGFLAAGQLARVMGILRTLNADSSHYLSCMEMSIPRPLDRLQIRATERQARIDAEGRHTASRRRTDR